MNNLPEKWCINLRNAPQEVIDYCNKYGARPSYESATNRDVYAHFPAVNVDGSLCTTAYRRSEYTEITHEQFLNRRTYPFVNGEVHHIKAFIKDVENLGFEYNNLDDGNPSGVRLNGNNFKVVGYRNYVVIGVRFDRPYTGPDTETVKYQLPQDWNAALEHFKKCKVWRDEVELKTRTFKVGFLNYVVDTTGVYFIDASGGKVKISYQDEYTEIFNYYNEIRK